MNTKKLLSSQKIILVLLILVVLLFGYLYLSRSKSNEVKEIEPAKPIVTQQPTPYPVSGSYQITLSNNKIKAGDKVFAVIEFTVLDKRVFGTDVVLHFDPLLLEAEKKLITGDYFQNFPRLEVDNQKGQIKVTAFGSSKDKTTQKANVFTAAFKAKKAGTTNLSFDFEKRRTNLTTLVEEGTSRNILAEANPVQIVIEP